MKKIVIFPVIAIAFVALAWFVVRYDPRDLKEVDRAYLLQLAYRAHPGQQEKLVGKLNERIVRRQNTGLIPGDVLLRQRTSDPSRPDVVWEIAYATKDQLMRGAEDDEATATVAEAVWQRLRLWKLHDGEDTWGPNSNAVIGRNYYYPGKGHDGEVLSWRVHASEVRTKLGFRRGRVYSKIAHPAIGKSENATDDPTVMWELEYRTSIDRRAERNLVKTDEFKAVMAHMRTLLASFESSSWQISTGAMSDKNKNKTVSAGRNLHIDDPIGYWKREGFVEMVPPIRMPTTPDRSDVITVWLKIPAGGKIQLQRPDDPASLIYPPGTIADRVEFIGDNVADVRGTTFDTNGQELFHIYRGQAANDGSKKASLQGFEWLRGDLKGQQWADQELGQFLHTAIMPGMAGPLSPMRRQHLLQFNQCAHCHIYNKPATLKIDSSKVQLPKRPTDGHGLYLILSVLSNSAPIADHRPYDVNADDPYISVTCAGKPARLVKTERGRGFICNDNVVPIGQRNIIRGLIKGDVYTRRVCDSRRYLQQHMDPQAKKAYQSAFTECQLNSDSSPP